MIKIILKWLIIWLILYILVLAILKLWGKGKQFVIKKLAMSCQKDFDSKQYEKEIKKLKWLIWLNPTSTNYSVRASVYYFLEKYEDAIKDISKAISINSNIASYFDSRAIYYKLTGKNDLAIEDYNSAINLKFNSKDDYKLFLSRADRLYDKKEYQLAIIDYDIVIKNIPEEIEAYIGKGLCLANLKKYEEAIEIYNQGIEINNVTDLDLSDLFVYKGNSLFPMQKNDDAFLCYQKAIDLDINNSFAYLCRGEKYYNLKKVNEALQDLNKVLELKPTTNDSSLFLWLGVLYAVDGKDNERAMIFLQKAKELGNKDAQECIDELNDTGKIIMEW